MRTNSNRLVQRFSFFDSQFHFNDTQIESLAMRTLTENRDMLNATTASLLEDRELNLQEITRLVARNQDTLTKQESRKDPQIDRNVP